MSSYVREMTVSYRQKRWKRAIVSKDGHMDAHIVELQ